jgi:DNA-directed RNA polymerase specialized sigma24 family protein
MSAPTFTNCLSCSHYDDFVELINTVPDEMPDDMRPCFKCETWTGMNTYVNKEFKYQREKTLSNIQDGEWPTFRESIRDRLKIEDVMIMSAYKAGFTMEEIGNYYGITKQAVDKRLAKVRGKINV